MTNEQIIENAKIALASEGKIKIENGEIETIHTYATWKELGYQVQKGEKAIASIRIWKMHVSKAIQNKDAEDEEKAEANTGKMRMVNAWFFSASQVKPCEKKATRKGRKTA